MFNQEDILAALDEGNYEINKDTEALSYKKVRGESVEHIDFGDKAFGEILETYDAVLNEAARYQLYDPKEKTFCLPNNLELSYGQVVALAGDFFAIPKEPICDGKDEKDQEERFLKAYQSLAYKAPAYLEVRALLEAFTHETKRIKEALTEDVTGETIPSQLRDAEEETTKNYAKILAHKPRSFWDIRRQLYASLPPIINSRYTDILQTNCDHFMPEAQIAYSAGHRLAVTKALEAEGLSDSKEKYRLLVEALMLEAFAGHYLTDAFSAGHMRVPRKELPHYAALHHGYVSKETIQQDENPHTFFDSVSQTIKKTTRSISKLDEKINVEFQKDVMASSAGLGSLGHLLVHEQHDEDGDHGLWVTNQINSSGWQAFGDKHFFSDKSKENTTMAIAAIKAGLEDVLTAYQTGQNPKEGHLLYWPEVEKPELGRNHYAMFAIDKSSKKLLKREDTKDIHCQKHTDVWDAKSVLDERGLDAFKEGMKLIF